VTEDVITTRQDIEFDLTSNPATDVILLGASSETARCQLVAQGIVLTDGGDLGYEVYIESLANRWTGLIRD
jgi:hypothetical protein